MLMRAPLKALVKGNIYYPLFSQYLENRVTYNYVLLSLEISFYGALYDSPFHILPRKTNLFKS